MFVVTLQKDNNKLKIVCPVARSDFDCPGVANIPVHCRAHGLRFIYCRIGLRCEDSLREHIDDIGEKSERTLCLRDALSFQRCLIGFWVRCVKD